MAAIYSIMTAINGQLNAFSKFYEGKLGIIGNLPRVPSFVIVSADRAVEADPTILEDQNENIILDLVTKLNVGKDQDTTSLYICTAKNIRTSIIDKIPVIIPDYGCRTGFSIIVPHKLYDENSSIEEVSKILKDLYLSILNYDKDMLYKAEPSLLYMHNSKKSRVPSYDLTMILAAICLQFINLKSWFSTDTGALLDPVYSVDSFSDNELAPKYKSILREVLVAYTKSVDILTDGIASGLLLKDYLYK